LTPNDELAAIAADIVSEAEHEPVVRRLLAQPQGVWIELVDLVSGSKRLSRASELASCRATWLDFPKSAYGSGYCTIIFFSEELHWHTIALYNRARLEHAG
jgi:hypothetical protein